MDVAAIDRAVARAQQLCREAGAKGLPERAGLQSLLRTARATDSPAEVALFVRYQAARERRHRDFLNAVADDLEQDYADDIVALRRFLGFLVRAGHVERQAARGDGRGRRGR